MFREAPPPPECENIEEAFEPEGASGTPLPDPDIEDELVGSGPPCAICMISAEVSSRPSARYDTLSS